MKALRITVLGCIFASLSAGAVVERAFADGWHNAALYTSDLDGWAQQAASALPKGNANGQQGVLRAGVGAPGAGLGKATDQALGAGAIAGNLDARQEQQAARSVQNLIEVLAYMDSRNIIPREFPNFEHDLIPKYRERACALLKQSGATGIDAVIEQLRSLLMGGGPVGDVNGFHPDFVKQLLQLLDAGLANNQVSADKLIGLLVLTENRDGDIGRLAQSIRQAIQDRLDIPGLLELAEAARGQQRIKDLVMNMVDVLIESRSPSELAMVLSYPDASASIRRKVIQKLQRDLRKLDELALLMVVKLANDNSLRSAAWKELQGRTPTFAGLHAHIPAMLELADETGKTDRVEKLIAQMAQSQLQKAFEQSSGEDSEALLRLLANRNRVLYAIAVPAVASNIGRADASERARYQAEAMKFLRNRSAPDGTQSAALWMLSYFSNKNAIDKALVAQVVDCFPYLQTEAFDAAGSCLQRMTGEDFGPHGGDSSTQVFAAKKRWEAWLQTQ